MIQRKQTIFLLLAVIAMMACLCMPVGKFMSGTMQSDSVMYNLWLTQADGSKNFAVWSLFAIGLITITVSIAAIFTYMNRRLQARLCVFNILLCIGWYAVYVVFTQTLCSKGAFKPEVAACFPLVGIILYILARKGIMDDERLVRAADRIR